LFLKKNTLFKIYCIQTIDFPLSTSNECKCILTLLEPPFEV